MRTVLGGSGANHTARITQIVLTFSEPLDEARYLADRSNYLLRQGSRDIDFTVVYDPASLTATLTPQTQVTWKKRSKVTLTVRGAGTIADRAGNQLDGDFVRRLSQGLLLPPARSALAAAVDEVLALTTADILNQPGGKSYWPAFNSRPLFPISSNRLRNPHRS